MSESPPKDRALDTNVRRKGSRYVLRAALCIAIALAAALAIFALRF